MKRNVYFIFTLLLVFGLNITATQAQSDPYAMGPKIGSEAPNFKLKTLDGKEIELKELRGKLVLIDFWGIWCPPCRMEVPHMVEAYKEFHKKGLEIISLNVGDEMDDLKEFIKEKKMIWKHVSVQDEKLMESYAVSVFPTPYLIDHNGKIAAKGMDLRMDGLKKTLEVHIKKLPKQEETKKADKETE